MVSRHDGTPNAIRVASALLTIINKTKYTLAALFIGRVREQQISEYLPSRGPFHRHPNKRPYISADLKIVVNTALSLSLSLSLLFSLPDPLLVHSRRSSLTLEPADRPSRPSQREKNQLSRLCEISMQLRAIAKSSRAIDGRIIERPAARPSPPVSPAILSARPPSLFHPSLRFY